MQIHSHLRLTTLISAFTVLILWGCSQEAENTPVAQWTPLPLVPSTSTPTPTPKREVPFVSQPCEDDARFLEDLTIPDGSVVLPGMRLDKRWSVQNSGTCDWGPGYRLIRLGDDDFKGPTNIALYPAKAGSTALWQVILNAPNDTGVHVTQWQAQSSNTNVFGEVVYLLVNVEEPTPTPTSTPLISPTSES